MLLPILMVILFPAKTFAWGKKGHEMVAEVAFKYLDENTKKTVLEYLDGMTIEQAANWMDDMRADHSYDYMKPYHYVNFEKGEAVKETEGDNIIFILDRTIKELQNKNTLSKAQIKTKLLMLFHLIGDLHQPLHVGYGSDKGGNTMQINFNDQGTNLHALWDSGIIDYKNITLLQCLDANHFSNKEITTLQEINVANWARESRNFIDKMYIFEDHKIPSSYADSNAPLIENQILKAGIRLAGILKAVFKN